jgi:hypothetical protein
MVVAISSSSKDDDQKQTVNKESNFDPIGGLKDEVEISGVERDAAIASPLKGKKRLTSTACTQFLLCISNSQYYHDQGIVKVEKTGNETYMTSRTQKLVKLIPNAAINQFRRAFIPTYIAWVAEFPDPWRIESEQVVEAMNKIWAQIYGRKVPYEITTNTDVYKKVCCLVFIKMASALMLAIYRRNSVYVTLGTLPLAPQQLLL